MPRFHYTPTTPDAGSIGDLMLRRGQIAGNRARMIADIEAQAAMARGQIWGNAIGSVGDVISRGISAYAQEQREAPIRKQEAELRDLNIQSGKAELATAKRATEEKAELGSALSSNLDPDAIEAQLTEGGFSQLVPAFRKSWNESETAKTTLKKARADAEEAESDYFGALAAGVKAFDYDPGAVKTAFAKAKADGYDDADGILQQLEQNPDSVKALVDSLIQKSPTQRKLAGEEADRALRAKQEERAILTAQQAQADRESDNARQQKAQEETGRHNQELERIAGLTAGRTEATAAEAARHNRTMEGIAQQNADTTRNRYTSSGIDSTMDTAHKTALERAVLGVPAARRPAVASLANRLWAEGNTTELKDVIRQAAIESENVDTKNQVLGRMATLASLRDTRDILKELEAKGVPTGWLTGTVENLARRLGKTTNPEYVALSNRLMGTLINYRRAATGVAFSARESADYERMFPNYKNDLPVNLAQIDGIERELTTYDKEYWTHKLGEHGSALVGVGRQTGEADDAYAAYLKRQGAGRAR